MYISQVSGERLQDHWSSGLKMLFTFFSFGLYFISLLLSSFFLFHYIVCLPLCTFYNFIDPSGRVGCLCPFKGTHLTVNGLNKANKFFFFNITN